MNRQRFDDFTRLLARGVSRRTVLTVLGSVTGALLGGLGRRPGVHAQQVSERRCIPGATSGVGACPLARG